MMPNFVLCFGSKKAILQKLVVVLQVQIFLFFFSIFACKKLMSKVNFDSFWNSGKSPSSCPKMSHLQSFLF